MTRKEAKKLLDISFAVLAPYFKKKFGFFPNFKIRFCPPSKSLLKQKVPFYMDNKGGLVVFPEHIKEDCLMPLLEKSKREHYCAVGYWLYAVAHDLVHFVHCQFIGKDAFTKYSNLVYIEGVAEIVSWEILSEIYAECRLMDDFKRGTSPLKFLCEAMQEKKLRESIEKILLWFAKAHAKGLRRVGKRFVAPSFLPPKIKNSIKRLIKSNPAPRRKASNAGHCTKRNRGWLPYSLGLWYTNKLFQSGKGFKWLVSHLLSEEELSRRAKKR